MKRVLIKFTASLITVFTVAGCSTVQPDRDVFPDDPNFAPVSAQSLEAPPTNDGSLFQPRYSFGLYTDQQATRVGDIITVIFDEQYQSSKSAETVADKSSSNNMAVPSLMGTVP
ncbi:MAG: flagellar basal body L-ring protein FlgH, partial [Thalassolituus sp.]